MVLRFSSEQIAALQEHQARPWVEELFDHVELRLGAGTLHPQLGIELLSAALRTARACGIDSAAAQQRYAELVARVGRDLGSESAFPWAGELLDDPWLSELEKVQALEQALIDRGCLRT